MACSSTPLNPLWQRCARACFYQQSVHGTLVCSREFLEHAPQNSSRLCLLCDFKATPPVLDICHGSIPLLGNKNLYELAIVFVQNYHKVTGVKRHRLIKFLETRSLSTDYLGPLLGILPGCNQGVTWTCSLPWDKGCSSKCIRLLAKSACLWWEDWAPGFFSCWRRSALPTLPCFLPYCSLLFQDQQADCLFLLVLG